MPSDDCQNPLPESGRFKPVVTRFMFWMMGFALYRYQSEKAFTNISRVVLQSASESQPPPDGLALAEALAALPDAEFDEALEALYWVQEDEDVA